MPDCSSVGQFRQGGAGLAVGVSPSLTLLVSVSSGEVALVSQFWRRGAGLAVGVPFGSTSRGTLGLF